MKDLFIGMLKAIFVALIEAMKLALKKVDWKVILSKGYVEFRPKLIAKVEVSESKVDDAVVKALDVIHDKFLKPDAK